jgi:hypothetical protein
MSLVIFSVEEKNYTREKREGGEREKKGEKEGSTFLILFPES